MLRIGVDIGGTFTDFAAWREQDASRIVSVKVPSTPHDFSEGFRNGFEEVLALAQPAADEAVVVMHGTTVSTNTVIERSGPPIALFTTAGFKDILELARLRLSGQLNLFAERSAPLIPRGLVHEIDERLDAQGGVLTPLALDQVRAAAAAARAAGVSGVAVAFLHSYRNPAHEHAVRDLLAAEFPELDVSLSSEIWPKAGEYERAMVCILNAYVKRRMRGYIGQIETYLHGRLRNVRLFTTRSNGGAMAAADAMAHPVHTLLSGPASGVTAAQHLGKAAGRHMLTMDMGGTSTDLSLLIDGQPGVSSHAEVGDFPLMMPVTEIEAIGAGGGSIAMLDGSMLRVGPKSAGAFPGPACFGRGGTLPTVTDAYLVAGYLNPANFLGGRMRLDVEAARAVLAPLAAQLGMAVEAAAEAIIAVATSNMVASVLPYLARHGVDPGELTLVAFGGNGAIHAPLLADEVGIGRVLVPGVPSVFCALGGVVTELVHDSVTTVLGRALTPEGLKAAFADLRAAGAAWLANQVESSALTGVRYEHSAEMRYRGQSFELSVRLPEAAGMAGDLAVSEAAFHAEHLRLYTFADPAAPVEFTELRVRVRGALPAPVDEAAVAQSSAAGQPYARRAIRIGGAAHDAALYRREELSAGQAVAGPALIEQDIATILVPPGFKAHADAAGNLLVERSR